MELKTSEIKLIYGKYKKEYGRSKTNLKKVSLTCL